MSATPAEKLARLIEREGTGISWADLTFNPWIGCQAVSPACDHCYAAELAANRLSVTFGPGEARRRTAPGTWAKPPRWQKIAAEAGQTLNVFCASLADVFDNAIDNEWRADLARLITETPALRWMLLTKRIGNARAMLAAMFPEGVPNNIALGVTIANQVEADRDIPKAAAVKRSLGLNWLFLSCEPLLGPLDLSALLYQPCLNSLDGVTMDPATGAYECCRSCDYTGTSGDRAVDLVIVGGESGRGARPVDVDWVRGIRDQCADAGTPFHFKQWGEWLPGGQGNPHGVDLGRYEVRVKDGVEAGYRVGAAKSGHNLDKRKHREHFN